MIWRMSEILQFFFGYASLVKRCNSEIFSFLGGISWSYLEILCVCYDFNKSSTFNAISAIKIPTNVAKKLVMKMLQCLNMTVFFKSSALKKESLWSFKTVNPGSGSVCSIISRQNGSEIPVPGQGVQVPLRAPDAGIRDEVPHLRHDPHNQGDRNNRGGPVPWRGCSHDRQAGQAQCRGSVFIKEAHGCWIPSLQVNKTCS